MTSFTHHLTALFTGIAALGLSGCVLDSDPVPEMPYHPRAVPPQQPKQEEPVQTTTWEDAAAPSPFITTSAPAAPPSPKVPETTAPAAPPTPRVTPQAPAVPASAPVPAPPVPAAAPAPVEQPAQPTVINLPPPAAETPSAPPAPATPSAPATDLQQITNTGPIPTAARVEGDPTRVWNPLDPRKKIRIINPKTNQPYPSGKKLKVRGTNFQFYVP